MEPLRTRLWGRQLLRLAELDGSHSPLDKSGKATDHSRPSVIRFNAVEGCGANNPVADVTRTGT